VAELVVSGFSPSPNEREEGGAGFHDQFGNGLESWIVEKTGPRYGFEDGIVWEMDFAELLKSLPEMQRLALCKRMDGIPLTEAEQAAFARSKPAVGKWLEIRTKLRGTANDGDTQS
jgi:hypothetical protein